MLFSRIVVLFFIFMSGAQASDLKEIIQTREYGSCESNNLFFSAMKFYKVPLNEKFESYELFLRIILFFNPDGTYTERVTTQALLGCQTTSAGDVACSYHPLKDNWIKSTYSVSENSIQIERLGFIEFTNPDDTNRGFILTFKNDFAYPHLRGQNFIGGMVSVNFDQNARNTINICK